MAATPMYDEVLLFTATQTVKVIIEAAMVMEPNMRTCRRPYFSTSQIGGRVPSQRVKVLKPDNNAPFS